jgi:uncharacterized protein YegP (UPF0339 family)
MCKVTVQQSNEDEQWYWHVQDGNGEVVAQGEGYTREIDAWRGFYNATEACVSALTGALQDLVL